MKSSIYNLKCFDVVSTMTMTFVIISNNQLYIYFENHLSTRWILYFFNVNFKLKDFIWLCIKFH